jgi:hypothetical protein
MESVKERNNLLRLAQGKKRYENDLRFKYSEENFQKLTEKQEIRQFVNYESSINEVLQFLAHFLSKL